MNALLVAMTVMCMLISQTSLDHLTAFARLEPLEMDTIVNVTLKTNFERHFVLCSVFA